MKKNIVPSKGKFKETLELPPKHLEEHPTKGIEIY